MYLPILTPGPYTIYHLYPIPINNQTIIPSKPILILGKKKHLEIQDTCLQVEEYLTCRGDAKENINKCIPDLLMGVINLKLVNFHRYCIHNL